MNSASLLAIEPSLSYVTTASTGPNVVSWKIALNGAPAGSEQEVGLAALAASGTCYYLRDTANVGGAHAAGSFYGSTGVAANCTGTTALTAVGTKW